MREGLLKLSGGTEGNTVGVVVSREDTAPDYNTVKDLGGFYTRKITGADRTVYLSITDKYTGSIQINFDGNAANADPLTDAPQVMHPDTAYKVYVYNTADGTVVTQVSFTTDDFPATFPTSGNVGWSDVYTDMTAGPTIQVKADEIYFFPFRFRTSIFDSSLEFQLKFFDQIVITRDITESTNQAITEMRRGDPFPLTSYQEYFTAYDVHPKGPSDTYNQLWDLMHTPSSYYSYTLTLLDLKALNPFIKDNYVPLINAPNKLELITE